jgi:GntR family transcriptional regulator, phosphonate transport system regulatory protein
MVQAERGRGTFVARGRLAYPIGPRTRFTEIVTGEGHEAGAELIDHAVIEAEPLIAGRLGIAPGAPVLRLRLKRLVDGVPVSVGATFLPLPRFERFLRAFQKHKAITPALAACGVADYRRLETRISARLATGAEAVALGLGSGRVLLAADSVNVDPEGMPVQATQALFAADRLELVIASDVRPAGDR